MKVGNWAIELAQDLARKSPMRAQHGCVILNRNRILSQGYNTYLTSPHNHKWSTHAEEAALKKVDQRKVMGAKLIVVRIDTEGNTLMSKPCPRCSHLIQTLGIKAAYYTVPAET